jgi:hypothetical protein
MEHLRTHSLLARVHTLSYCIARGFVPGDTERLTLVTHNSKPRVWPAANRRPGCTSHTSGEIQFKVIR